MVNSSSYAILTHSTIYQLKYSDFKFHIPQKNTNARHVHSILIFRHLLVARTEKPLSDPEMEMEAEIEQNEMEWKETYEILREKHDEAQKLVNLAKKSEEQGNNEVALIKYKVGMAAIDHALATPVALPDDPDDVDETFLSAVNIVQMLKRTRGEVMHRIAILSPTTSQAADANGQFDRDSSSSPDGNGKSKRPRTFSELATELKNLEIDFNDAQNLPNVLELLFACHGVKLYRINANGEVTTTDESSTLRIVRLDQNVTQNLDATYFMQIIPSSAVERIDLNEDVQNEHDDGAKQPDAKKVREGTPPKQIDTSLIYPLVLGVSPCFRTDFGAFIFPDIQSNVPGAAIGIVVPQPADQIVLEILESVLHGVVRQKQTEGKAETEEEEAERKERDRRYASERISENIVHGACLISNGLVKGTEQVSKLVSYTTPYLLSKMNKAPENAPPVSNKVANGIEIAKTATGVAVGITSFVAAKVGSATMALGQFLAPHVHAQGSKLLSKSMGYSTDEAKDKVSVLKF